MEKLNLFTNETLRLDEFLRRELPSKIKTDSKQIKEISNSKIRRLILAFCVSVNGKKCCRPAFELRGKSFVNVEFDFEKFFYEKQPDDIKFEVTEKSVLYEDENLIFINKPAFFPVEQTITGNRDNLHDSVVNFLWKRNPELRNSPYVGIMHRLDKDTSGVILFTKNRAINKAVSDMFQNHNFTKEYIAVCSENKKSNSSLKKGSRFTVEKFMGRISGKSKTGKWGTLNEKDGGQYSKTDFEIIDEKEINRKKYFVVKCSLFTGRTHQIRVHLSEAGLPILGDELYGGQKSDRLYLHSTRIACHTENLDFDVTAPCEWKFTENFTI